ncbi:uncharacterized protein [Dysidea avara]|uniref:uncharacterized protein isoform X1 n=1 Tax=Dysidea avara TaxID=196820 RepID=UPI00331A4A6B
MRRALLAGVSIPLPPAKSRIVEAICCLLSLKYQSSQMTSGAGGKLRIYQHQSTLILKEYRSIRARVYNSPQLLEGTNLALYHVNQNGLQKWLKGQTRKKEIVTLMQGLKLTVPSLCSSKNLPPVQDQPSSSPPPPEPHHQITEPEDTTGQARKRTISSSGTLGTVSRTQEWRIQRKQRLKAAATAGLDVDNLPPPPRKRQKQHKTHKCSKFHKTLNAKTGHSQFHGAWYCPAVDSAIPINE